MLQVLRYVIYFAPLSINLCEIVVEYVDDNQAGAYISIWVIFLCSILATAIITATTVTTALRINYNGYSGRK